MSNNYVTKMKVIASLINYDENQLPYDFVNKNQLGWSLVRNNNN